MSQPAHEQIEDLLWLVHDECMAFARDNNERTVSNADNFSRLFIALADLAKSLAGGYREGGLRQ